MEIVISNKGATLEGNASDAQQKPFSNAEVIAIPSDPKLRKRFDLLHTTTADTQGHFKFRGVRPGEYVVFALENSQAQPFMTDLFFKQFDTVMTGLEQFVENADNATLEKIAPNVARISMHNAYHIGEIIAVRKEHGMWNPDIGVK